MTRPASTPPHIVDTVLKALRVQQRRRRGGCGRSQGSADQLLVARGLAESRTRAQALIMAGAVFSGEQKIAKAGDMLAEDAPLEVEGQDHPWVSRGGIKLDHGLTHFGFDVTGAVALDVGSSTGGFTDVLLSRGAAKVYAVDVGTNQLAWKLRQDPRVIVHEQTNARNLDASIVPEPVDIVVCDASFIGLAKVLDAPLGLAKPGREAGRAGQAAVRGRARGSRQGRGGPRPRRPPARLRRGRGLGRIAGLARARRRPKARSPGPKAMSNSCWERSRNG